MSDSSEPKSPADVLLTILGNMNTGRVQFGLNRKSLMANVDQTLRMVPELKADPNVIGEMITCAVTYPGDGTVQDSVFRALRTGGSDAQKNGFVELLRRHPHVQDPDNTDVGTTRNRVLFVQRARDLLGANPTWKTIPEVTGLGLS